MEPHFLCQQLPGSGMCQHASLHVVRNDQVLIDDLTHVELKPTMDGRIQLRSKDEMKKEGIPSPNDADALALTFALQIVHTTESIVNTDYDPYD